MCNFGPDQMDNSEPELVANTAPGTSQNEGSHTTDLTPSRVSFSGDTRSRPRLVFVNNRESTMGGIQCQLNHDLYIPRDARMLSFLTTPRNPHTDISRRGA